MKEWQINFLVVLHVGPAVRVVRSPVPWVMVVVSTTLNRPDRKAGPDFTSTVSTLLPLANTFKNETWKIRQPSSPLKYSASTGDTNLAEFQCHGLLRIEDFIGSTFVADHTRDIHPQVRREKALKRLLCVRVGSGDFVFQAS